MAAYAGWAGSLPPGVGEQRLQQVLELADQPPERFVSEIKPSFFSGYGDQDVRAPLDVPEALRAAIPTSRLVVLPGVGHMTCIEAGDRFNAEVRAFLTPRR